MAKFDIISAAGRAYRISWEERRYLLRLAAAPFLIKLVCLVVAGSLVGDGNLLRFYLIMVPSYLAEGWMLSHYVRLLTCGQRWPFRPAGDPDKDMKEFSGRLRGVTGGMVVYTLINMVLGLFTFVAAHYLGPYMPSSTTQEITPVPPVIALFSFAAIIFMFWGIRLLWLYIPYAMNMHSRDYLLRMRGINTSVYMIGLWFACLIPFFLILQIAAALFAAPVAAAFGTDAGNFVVLLLTVVTATVKGLVVTAGITYALMEVYSSRRQS